MLQVSNVNKNFGAVVALKNTSLSIKPGEIRALLGANGSGKSTLVKVLGGMVKPDKAEILLEDKPLLINSPKDSRRYKISVAYQDLSLVPQLTIAENIMLGQEPRGKFRFTDNKIIMNRSLEFLSKLGVNIPADTLVSDLDDPSRALVEVAKALSWDPKILILDEVTASLHHNQVNRLFEVLRELQREGLAIVFVSHRFDEVFSFCSTATILRGGQTVASVDIGSVNEEELVYHMTGKYPDKTEGRKQSADFNEKKEIVLSLKDFRVEPKVKGISMEVYKGEILGIGGLQGQGQAELVRAIYGAIPKESGNMIYEGKSVNFKSPSEAVNMGLGFISGDREKEAIMSVRPVSENLYSAKMALKKIFSRLNTRQMEREVKESITQLKIVAGSINHPANSLSGGNQQKLVVGRWLTVKPKILILDDPTKGVDVSARREIHQILKQMTNKGTTVIISSSDNEELLDISDRILVFYEGKIADELNGENKIEEKLVGAMLGISKITKGGDS